MSDARGDFKIDARDTARVTAIGGDVKADHVDFGDHYESNAPREITVSVEGWIPPNFQDYWVDRATYQTQLVDRLKANPVTEILADGGFGKSSLAAWAHGTLRSQFDKRIWVEFPQPKSFYNVARWVLQEIGFPNKDPEVREEGLLRELVYRLNDPNAPVKTLVVLDQLEAILDAADWQWFEAFLKIWAEQGQGSRILVTTRSGVLSQDPIALGGLDTAEAAVFFERAGLTGTGLAELNALAGGHPLLLKLAAAWTKETYGGRVDDSAIDFFGKLFANYQDDPKAGVAAIFGVIFDELPIGWRDLLCGVSVYRLAFGAAMAQAIAADATIDDLKLLADRGLLLRQGEAFTLHPLVADLVRSRVTDERRRAAHEGAIGYYSANFQDWDGTIKSCREELESFYHACELGQYQRAYGMLDRCVNQLDRAGEWRFLLPLCKRLTSEWQAADDAESKNLGWAWTNLGNLSRNLGDYQLAIVSHEQAQAIFAQIDFPQGQAASLGNLGYAYQSLGQYQRAIDFLQKALEIMRAIGDRGGEANSLGNLGNAYYSLGQYQRAIDYHQQSLEMARAIGDRGGEAKSLGSLGNAYQSLGQYQRAIDFHQQSLEIKRAIGDRGGEAASLGNLGNAYYSLGQYQRAIDYHQQHNEMAREIGDRGGEAKSLGNLGIAYQSLGQYQRAIDYHQQSLEMAREIGDRWGEGASLFNMANSLAKLDNHPQALLNFQKAKTIYEELELDHMVEKCNEAIRNVNQIIAPKHEAPPRLEIPQAKPQDEWLETNNPINERKVAATRSSDNSFWFWFVSGLAIVLLIYWLKR